MEVPQVLGAHFWDGRQEQIRRHFNDVLVKRGDERVRRVCGVGGGWATLLLLPAAAPPFFRSDLGMLPFFSTCGIVGRAAVVVGRCLCHRLCPANLSLRCKVLANHLCSANLPAWQRRRVGNRRGWKATGSGSTSENS